MQHYNLTPLRDNLNFDTVNKLNQEIYQNATSIHSTMCGGTAKCLYEVLSPQDLLAETNIPYVEPQYPPPLVFPPGTTQHIASHMIRQHEAQKAAYHQVQGVRNEILQ